MAYHITWNQEGTIVNLSGLLSIDEINEANGIVHGDARLDNHKYSIWNFLEADLSQLTESDLLQPAATDGAASISILDMKVAIVAVDSHAVKVLEHYVQYAIQVTTWWEFGIFNSMQDALHWAESL